MLRRSLCYIKIFKVSRPWSMEKILALWCHSITRMKKEVLSPEPCIAATSMTSPSGGAPNMAGLTTGMTQMNLGTTQPGMMQQQPMGKFNGEQDH